MKARKKMKYLLVTLFFLVACSTVSSQPTISSDWVPDPTAYPVSQATIPTWIRDDVEVVPEIYLESTERSSHKQRSNTPFEPVTGNQLLKPGFQLWASGTALQFIIQQSDEQEYWAPINFNIVDGFIVVTSSYTYVCADDICGDYQIFPLEQDIYIRTRSEEYREDGAYDVRIFVRYDGGWQRSLWGDLQ